MNKPTGVGLFFFPSSGDELGSIALPPIIRLMRPVTFALWLVIFVVQVYAVVASHGANWLVLLLSTLLFGGVHFQFWIEESEQGRRFKETFERMRGRIYEDEETGLPNSRHFVFQLRRQMMRSVRNGRGFSIVLATLGDEGAPAANKPEGLTRAAKSLRQCIGDCDFVARLQGPSFGAIVLDENEATATHKAHLAQEWLSEIFPNGARSDVQPAVSITGYEGELEVRDFLRRAQRDLQLSQEILRHPRATRRPTGEAA